jgi:hypothetical protein
LPVRQAAERTTPLDRGINKCKENYIAFSQMIICHGVQAVDQCLTEPGLKPDLSVELAKGRGYYKQNISIKKGCIRDAPFSEYLLLYDY